MSKNAKNIFNKTLAMSNDINFRGKEVKKEEVDRNIVNFCANGK